MFSPSALQSLQEKTDYESWFLEAIYAIAEQEFFPTWPDAVVYPIGRSRALFMHFMRGNAVVGDWRPPFLKAGVSWGDVVD